MSRASGRRKSQLRPVRGLVGSVLEDLGLPEVARAARVGEYWAEAVGPEGARHSWPDGLRGGVLEVRVDTSVWCQHLQMRRTHLLEALREALGEDAPEDLRFRVGYSEPR